MSTDTSTNRSRSKPIEKNTIEGLRDSQILDRAFKGIAANNMTLKSASSITLRARLGCRHVQSSYSKLTVDRS
jgi:hypothetical protein